MLEVAGESLAFEGFAYQARFHPIDQECVASSLILIQAGAFGGTLVVEGGTLDGVTSLAPSEAMDEQMVWYQDPGPNWTEEDPSNFAYGGLWRLSQVVDSLVVSLEPERICPGLPLSGGCEPGVPVQLTLRGAGLNSIVCDRPAEMAWPDRSNGEPPLCAGYPIGPCDPPDETGN